MRKFCTFHAEEGHATSECPRNTVASQEDLVNIPTLTVASQVASPDASTTKQEKWRMKNKEKYKEYRKLYMYKKRHPEKSFSVN